MPPKVVKRGAAAKKANLSSKTAIQNQKQEPEPEPVNNHEENHVADVAAEENPVETVPNGLAAVENNGEEVKDSIDEYEKDEHLDLEDNYHESDPDEYVGDDYDERENEQDDGQEGVDEVEEELEEIMDEELEEIVDEEDGDTGEEVEYVYEEVEDDDDDEDAAAAAGNDDDHAGMKNEHEHLAVGEKEEQGEVRKERQKPKEFEVFVGGLDKNATEDDLRKIFGKVGEITKARLMKNPQTKRNKGFALLRFKTVGQVKRALAELKNPVINGKQCGITPCQDSNTLYLDNICKTWKKEALKEKLKHYEIESFKDLTLVEDGNDEGTNCGFALLEFSSRSDAKEAYKRLQKKDVVFGVDKPAEVSFADSFDDPEDDIMAQVKTVFIDLLPSSWDEDYVRSLLKKYGEVEKVELAKNRPTARRKNYGFVTFATHAAAVECAESITGAGLGEGNKKAKVRARLFRPLPKVRGKHVTRSDFSGRKLGRSARPSRSRPSLQSRFALRSRLGPPIRPTLQSRLGPPSRSARVERRLGNSIPSVRPSSSRNRRPVTAVPVRARPATPPARSYERRLTAAYPKGSMKRDYARPVDLPPPRSRVSADYGSQVASQRRSSYRDYPARDSGYSDLHRSASRTAPRRSHLDDSFDQRLERPPPLPPSHLSYREGRPRDYDTLSGSKRPYATIDDIPPRYADVDARQSRSRLNYDYGGSVSEYRETYGDRLGRSSLGYNSSSRSSTSIQNSHGAYSSRQDMSYGRGSIGGSDGGIYSSSYGGDYISRGSDAGGSSYSSMYSSRGMNGSSSYMGGGGSRSYY
ncbi:uncharacterized protein LOC131609748 isoform X2 [Vicia villosa]|uniref:uncharacterized protein LOC131609748 isoform X2 n=1 Tax=Vicia villosa TaxID=3911 RepID=UPI00273B8370|nr:uncharacterized protein LOC131609748 isoform X2 [Vicia villosa]